MLKRANAHKDDEDRILLNYKRVSHGKGNVYYAPINYGLTCVRDATHFMLMKELRGKSRT